VYLKDRNKTVVCLSFTSPLKIEKNYAKMSSDRIPQEYSSGRDPDATPAEREGKTFFEGLSC